MHLCLAGVLCMMLVHSTNRAQDAAAKNVSNAEATRHGKPPQTPTGAAAQMKHAEAGDAAAKAAVGDAFLNGLGVANDEAQAVKWYRKAVAQNNAEAREALACSYRYHLGVAWRKIPKKPTDWRSFQPRRITHAGSTTWVKPLR